ncbi:MAG: 16S rRNA (cytosine(1402)-N(4))-methyltransferase [Thiothrix sp.]|nr:MAG: 16S rRNA (cytosine(1402)-N(4))-methyltransferase [Thiothrix sp.]
MSHTPVLYVEALQALSIKPGGRYLDATFGRGGHGQGILNSLGEAGRLFAMDKDPRAADLAARACNQEPRLVFRKGSFANMDEFLQDEGVYGDLDGIFMDLGVSSPQLDSPERGFSFSHDGPLDMRMDTAAGVTAGQWINAASQAEITKILKVYGEERYAGRIAHAIVQARTESEITTTFELAGLVRAAIPNWERGKDPATRSFQALRIEINQELKDLETGLERSIHALRPGGCLVVISFHSLEDRIVKHFMRGRARPAPQPRRMPPSPVPFHPELKIIGKPSRPQAEEVAANPRARSAIMRVAEKLA